MQSVGRIEWEKKQRRILGSPPSKIVLTVLYTLLQDVCSSFPELASVSKSYIHEIGSGKY